MNTYVLRYYEEDTSYILSQFEYSPLVWHFCSRSKMKQIEKVQKQALRYALNNFNGSYELLEKPNRRLMYTHRLRSILSFVENRIGGKCPMYLNGLFAVNAGGSSRKLKLLVQPKI